MTDLIDTADIAAMLGVPGRPLYPPAPGALIFCIVLPVM
jgi:hypothetical protein